MVTKVVMPRLSLTMKEGTVGKWYKKEGEKVEKNEPIVEVLSEKATYDLEAPASGVLRKIMLQEGVTAPVDEVLAIITDPDEAFSENDIRKEPVKPIEITERVPASPAAKRLARELGVELSLVKGSGLEGRIAEEDVHRYLQERRGEQPKVKEVIPLSGYRKASADKVSASFRTAPLSTLFMDVEATKATELHRQSSVSYTAIIVDAVAKALPEHPMINSTLAGDQLRLYEDVNVGVATATEHGLVVPVIRNANVKSLQEIDASIKDLAEKAKAGKLTSGDISGGTFTVTNLGMFGVEFFTPIINPPEAAILGVGTLEQKPIVVDGRIEARPVMRLSLSYDHRIVDGAPASDFLRRVKQILEKGS